MLFEVTHLILQLLVARLKAQHLFAGVRLRLFLLRPKLLHATRTLLMRGFRCFQRLSQIRGIFQ